MSAVRAARTPEEFLTAFKANFDSGELERVLAGYTHDAVLNMGGSNVFHGKEAVGKALTKLLAPHLPIETTLVSLTTSGETSVVVFDWKMEGKDPSGGDVKLAGRAIDVLRRGDDGIWRQHLDLPFGAVTQAAAFSS